jgi:hypothetical protein
LQQVHNFIETDGAGAEGLWGLGRMLRRLVGLGCRGRFPRLDVTTDETTGLLGVDGLEIVAGVV